MTISTLTLDATKMALRASGAYPIQRAAQGLITGTPAPGYAGWSVATTGACLLHIALRASLVGRTTYLVINRATAPLTGTYEIEVNNGGDASVTYNATVSAPANVDALLAGIVAALNALSAAGQIGTKVVATVQSYTLGGAFDCIRLVGVAGEYVLTAGTVFPVGAALVNYGEALSATGKVYLKLPAQAGAVLTTLANQSGQTAWTLSASVTVPVDGYIERLALAGFESADCRLVMTMPADTATVVPVARVAFLPCEDSA